jgi:hypothetical protein
MVSELASAFTVSRRPTCEPIRESPALEPTLAVLIHSVKAHGLEGLATKRRDSRSEPGQRSGGLTQDAREPLTAGCDAGYTLKFRSFVAIICDYFECHSPIVKGLPVVGVRTATNVEDIRASRIGRQSN